MRSYLSVTMLYCICFIRVMRMVMFVWLTNAVKASYCLEEYLLRCMKECASRLFGPTARCTFAA